MVVLAVIATGAMMLSAFTTPKQDCSQVEMNDGWKLFRENVPYCDGDKGTCLGTGDVWVNTETSQVQIRIYATGTYDLVEYRGKDGYNMRFWHGKKNMYCYVMISGINLY